MNEILLNNRANQVTGAIDWLTFTDAGFPDLPEVYTIADLDANRSTDGGHFRNLFGIRLGKIPDPETLRIFEYLPDSNSDSFDSDSEAGAEYSRAASFPPAAGEFATEGAGDIVYFHSSQAGVQVAVLPYSFRATPLTVEKIKAFAQAAVSGSELDALVDAAVDAAIAEVGLGAYPPGHRNGLTIANNGTDGIDVAPGSARDDSDTINIDYAGGTIQTDTNFGTGDGSLDTGSAGDGTYHLWLIIRSDTNVAKVISSLSPTAPTMPANYDYKAYLYPIIRSGGNVVSFTQIGRRFDLNTPVLYSTGADPGTARVTATLSGLPTGIELQAIVQAGLNGNGTNTLMTVRPLTETDAAPSLTAAPFFDVQAYNIGNATFSNEMQVRTNTSAQVAVRLTASGNGQIGYVLQKGWIV